MFRKIPVEDGLVMGDPVAQRAQRGERPREVLAAETLAVLASGDAVQVLLPEILVFLAEERRPEAEGEGRYDGAGCLGLVGLTDPCEPWRASRAGAG